MIRNYFQVIVDASTQEKRDRANHAATLMDRDPWWNTHDYGPENWSRCNGDTKWYSSNPASDSTQAVVAAWLDSEKDYDAPEFVIFRTGKGDGQGFRTPMSEADFNLARAELIVEVQKTEEQLRADHNLVPDNVFEG